MPWLPPNANAPSFDSGYFTGIGAALTGVTGVTNQAAVLWVLCCWARNKTGVQQTFDLADGSGVIFGTWDVPDGFSGPIAEVPFMPKTGLKVKASVNSANFGLHLWGYQ
jgi:hypothetical protein